VRKNQNNIKAERAVTREERGRGVMMEPWEQTGKKVIRRILKKEMQQDPSRFTIKKEGYFFLVSVGENQPEAYITRGDIEDYLNASTEVVRLAAVGKIANKLQQATEAAG
jgi:hypothetical protein